MSMRFTEIGQQLRAYRLESGLRAEEIAARLGVSRAALYRYEKGEVIKLDTIKRLAELLKISPLSLLGIGVEYYNRPIGYFERIRQIEETADQILQLFGPVCYLTTSDAYDSVLGEAFDEAADQAGPERMAMRSMAEQVLGILAARKRMYSMRRPGIIAMVSLPAVQRLLDTGIAGGIAVSDRVRRLCREVAVSEIENIAAGHPKALMAAVIGVAHPKWDERPLLLVRLKDGESAEPEEFLRFLDGKIARWWMPDDVVFVDEIPLGATGKIDKKLIRQRFENYTLPTAKAAVG